MATETIIGDGGTGCIEGWGGNGVRDAEASERLKPKPWYRRLLPG